MRLYNTMTRQMDEVEFGPIVSLYVCGVTPYDTTHLGHAFCYSTFDVLIRYLRMLGHEVRYTQNVTDIDDDILRKSREVGIPWDELGRRETARFLADLRDLNVLSPTHYPRATAEIPGMVEVIARLIDKGHAYVVDRNVYFSAASARDFDALSGLDRETMLARFEDTGDPPADPRKRDRLDFVLWKESAPGEPEWEAPWGSGRPGWHIECSTMANHYLGPRIDIHGGGDDLIFPHHSCEIAQSEAATGERPFVRIWMHNAPVRLDGVKMSKSLGNLVLARTLLERYPADAIRVYLHQHHYRTAWDYDQGEMDLAAARAQRLAAHALQADSVAPQPTTDAAPSGAIETARRRFATAMSDDLDTPAALRALEELLAVPGNEAAATMRELGGVLGLQFNRPA